MFPDTMVAFLPQRPIASMISFRQCFPRDQPVKVEICSGHGDWIVERAKNDPHSNWVGLEIRHERVYQIWSKMRFEQLDNLMIIVSNFTIKSSLATKYLHIYRAVKLTRHSSRALLMRVWKRPALIIQIRLFGNTASNDCLMLNF